MNGILFAVAELTRDTEFVRKNIPKRARAFEWLCLGLLFGTIASASVLLAALINFGGDLFVPLLLTATVLISLTANCGVASGRIKREAQRIADAAELATHSAIQSISRSSAQSFESLQKMATQMKKQSDELKRLARVSGDTIISGNITVSGHGVVIIGSELVNSMNKNPEIADDLKILAGFVQKSGSEESKELLNELMKRTNAGESKVVTAALWERLVKLLPSITSLTDVFIKLSHFFASAYI